MRFEQLTASCVHGGYTYDGVSSIAFDAVEECIWTGGLTGSLYQHLTPTLDCYSVLNTNQSSGPVLRLQTLGQSVAALSSGQFGVYMSGGASRACYLDRRMDMSDMVYQHWNHRVLVGRSGLDFSSESANMQRRNLFMYDVIKSVVISEYETAHPVALMASLTSGQLAMASPTGHLMVFDPRQGHITGNGSLSHSKVFHHGFAALESSGNLIATSGYGGLAHRPALEPFVKVFDSRMGIKALASIPFSNGPTILRFHPTLRSTVLACSSSGMFSMVDTAGTTLESYFVDMGGDSVSACDFNMNGDCIVFGGANGGINLWGSGSGHSMTATGLVPEYAQPIDKSLVPHMDENTSFSVATNYAVHHGIEEMATASFVRPDEVMSVGLPPRVVDEALLNSQTSNQVDFVIHVANPKYDENNKPGESAAGAASVRNKRVRHRRSGKETEAAIHERARRRAQMGEVVLPRRFCRVSIKQQKGTRFEEFDFKGYNSTPFSGLENGLANCYMNPLIQVLYFCRPLRDCAMGHTPDPEEEFSLLGEMAFLFQMLATADGEVCQASNLLRALRQTSEAVALGLLEGVKGERGAVDIAVEAQKDKNLVRRIERLCRLLITRMDKEGGGAVGDIFCLHQRQKTTCLTHAELPPKEQDISTFQLELKYLNSKHQDGSSSTDFASILGNSLETSTDIKAWFNQSVKYQPVRQQRCPTTLPTVLITYTGLEDPSLIKFWEGDNASKFPYAVSVSFDKETGATRVSTAADLVKLKELIDDDGGARGETSGKDENIDLACTESGTSGHASQPSVATSTTTRDLYLLTGMLSYVYDKDEADEIGQSYEGHLIAHINVPGNYSKEPLGDVAGNTSGDLGLRWFTFNDFSITPCELGDVQNTFDGQKRPVLLFFTKVSYLEQAKVEALQGPAAVLGTDAFLSLCSAPPIQSNSLKRSDMAPKTFKPLSRRELPKKGDVFALDAEFVAYSAPEKMVVSEQDDWSRTSMRLGLGRVSLVRGAGPLAGTPCIDDFIRSVEPVYDHLTRYSGLLPGDLDAESSRRHLTTLRKAYLKLRFMVDRGCVFVGHGLKKDFRMLNLVVPKDQIVDTIDLFYSGRGRRLSLKFLVAFFLRKSIQEDVHDSIEDATAALRLYRLHHDLKVEGKFDELLARAMDWGSMAGWDPASWVSAPPHEWFE